MNIYNYASILVFLTSLITAQNAAYNSCTLPPQAEMDALIRAASPRDLELLFTLLYWSHERSAITLRTQSAAEQGLVDLWERWQGCVDRRLNPNARVPHEHTDKKIITFMELQKEFHVVHSEYSRVIEIATNERSYESKPVYHFVRTLREEARKHIVNILQKHVHEIKAELQLLFNTQETTFKGLFDIADNFPASPRGTGMVSQLINHLAVNSFAQMDASFILTSNICMLNFFKIQALYNTLWYTIETIRKKFYAAHFQYLRARSIKAGLPTFSLVLTTS